MHVLRPEALSLPAREAWGGTPAPCLFWRPAVERPAWSFAPGCFKPPTPTPDTQYLSFCRAMGVLVDVSRFSKTTMNPFRIALAMFCLIPASGLFAQAPQSQASTGQVEETKTCFQCKGAGSLKCTNARCVKGIAECPAPCLKLTQGEWKHINSPGYVPTDWWQTFRGKRGTHSWNQHHLGEVIEMQDGEPVNVGKCKVCGGKTTVVCSACGGKGELACPTCKGRGVLPKSWTSTQQYKPNSGQSSFILADGTVLYGTREPSSDGKLVIRTDNGPVEVDASEVVSEVKPAQP